MGQLFSLILIGVAGGATLAALLASFLYLLRRPVWRVAQTASSVPGRSFLVGLVNLLFFSVVAAVLARIGDALPDFVGGLFGLAGLFVVWVLFALLLVGAAGLVRLLAGRLWPPDQEGRLPAPGHALRAAFLFVAALLAPAAGWFVLLPLAALLALGAAIIGLLRWARLDARA